VISFLPPSPLRLDLRIILFNRPIALPLLLCFRTGITQSRSCAMCACIYPSLSGKDYHVSPLHHPCWLYLFRDVHPPEAMMHFPPVSDFPLFSKKFQTLWKIFQMLPFPEKFLDFHPPKFLMTFFSHRLQISNFTPIFPVSVHSPCFAKIIISTLLSKMPPPCFRKSHLLFTYFMCISFPPYFNHDAFMHHPMHVLDVAVSIHLALT